MTVIRPSECFHRGPPLTGANPSFRNAASTCLPVTLGSLLVTDGFVYPVNRLRGDVYVVNSPSKTGQEPNDSRRG